MTNLLLHQKKQQKNSHQQKEKLSRNFLTTFFLEKKKENIFVLWKVYYNGLAVAGCCGLLTYTGNTCVSQAQPKIGLGCKYPDGTNGESNTYGTLTIDEIRIYDHVRLTDEEILNVYNNDL